MNAINSIFIAVNYKNTGNKVWYGIYIAISIVLGLVILYKAYKLYKIITE